MANRPHQLAHDLRIGFSVKTMVGRPRLTENFDEGAVNGPSPRAVAPEKCTIDVEENESGRLNASRHRFQRRHYERVSRSPVMIETVPAICHTVMASPSTSQATTTAKM